VRGLDRQVPSFDRGGSARILLSMLVKKEI